MDMEAKVQQKSEIIVLIGHYLPGFKAGGPIYSMANIIEQLSNEYTFRVITRDRDLDSKEHYPNITLGQWTYIGKTKILYTQKGWRGFFQTAQVLFQASSTSVLYINGCYSFQFSLLALVMRRVGLLGCKQVILAPRGEFSPGAQRINSKKKRLYFSLIRWLGIYQNILWHASTEYEMRDVLRLFPSIRRANNASPYISGKDQSEIRIASDIPTMLHCEDIHHPVKQPGHLSVVSVSRISPMKNLEGALSSFAKITGAVIFDLYGPIEDAAYWKSCQQIASTLPANVQVNYCGIVEHNNLAAVLSRYNLFLLPSRGENFGHAIYEALAAGLPVLISDRTPWRDLEQAGVGWDVALSDQDVFCKILQQCVDADDAWFRAVSEKARRYSVDCLKRSNFVQANLDLFRSAFER